MAAEIQYLSSLDLQYKQDILKTMTRIYYRVSHFETDFLNWLWGIEGPIFSLIDCRKLDYSLLYTLKNYRPHISTFIQGATFFSESRGCYINMFNRVWGWYISIYLINIWQMFNLVTEAIKAKPYILQIFSLHWLCCKCLVW